MTMLMQMVPAGSSSTGGMPDPDTVSASAWFDGSADGLTRTSSAANGKEQWFSFWLKRGSLGTTQSIYRVPLSSGVRSTYIRFRSTNDLYIYDQVGSSANQRITTAIFIDTTAWYHIIIQINPDSGSPPDRIKIWVNGKEITSLSGTTNQHTQTGFDDTGVTHHIGGYSGEYFNGYLAQFCRIDGSGSYSNFGEFNSITGLWQPICDADIADLAASAGGESFCLTSGIGDGTDASGTQAGDDAWSPTSMSHIDNGSVDTPSNNLPTWNYSLPGVASSSLSNGARVFTRTTGSHVIASTFHATSGKYYGEIQNTESGTEFAYVGACPADDPILDDLVDSGTNQADGYWWKSNATLRHNTGTTSVTPTIVNNDRLMIGLDMDNGWLFLGKNGTWLKTDGTTHSDLTSSANAWATDLLSISSAGWTFAAGHSVSGGSNSSTLHASENEWNYTAPAGYIKLSAHNIFSAEQPVSNPRKYGAIRRFTGNGVAAGSGGNQVIGFNFAPDFATVKNIDQNDQFIVSDIVRGSGNYISWDGTDQSVSDGETIASFNSDGITLGDDVQVNTSTEDYEAFCLKAGGTPSTNTTGTISSSVSANPEAGFSIVQTSGTGVAGTIGHGLSQPPELIISKNTAGTDGWIVYHYRAASDPETDGCSLETNAAFNDSAAYWNDTAPTATVFSVGGGVTNVSGTNNMIYYCFHSVPGFSRIGVFTGNGVANGPFVHLGFTPFWFLGKQVTGAYRWWQYDDALNPHNDQTMYRLELDKPNAATDDNNDINFLSTGVKILTSNGEWNRSGHISVFVAFARDPRQLVAN